MGTSQTPSLLSVAEAATILRLSRATTYRLVSAGDLPASRVGGQLRIDLEQLREYLDDTRLDNLDRAPRFAPGERDLGAHRLPSRAAMAEAAGSRATTTKDTP